VPVTTARKHSRVAKFAGLAVAGIGLSHFTSPQLFDGITKAAFPRNTRQHVYIHGGVETALEAAHDAPEQSAPQGVSSREGDVVGGIGLEDAAEHVRGSGQPRHPRDQRDALLLVLLGLKFPVELVEIDARRGRGSLVVVRHLRVKAKRGGQNGGRHDENADSAHEAYDTT